MLAVNTFTLIVNISMSGLIVNTFMKIVNTSILIVNMSSQHSHVGNDSGYNMLHLEFYNK